MKAARFHAAKDIRVEEVSIPEMKDDSVKIEIEWCGLCGSDMHEYIAGPMVINEPTVTMGHEFSGTVTEIGEHVTSIKVGDRVVVEPFVACWKCEACRTGNYNVCENLQCFGLAGHQGGFAEFVVAPEDRVFKLPDTMSFEQGALVEPTAVVTHAVRNSQFRIGDTVAVFGAGPIGLLLVQTVKAAGASKIIVVEVSDTRRETALKLGATDIINPIEENPVQKIMSLTGNKGVDVAFEAAGVQPTFEAGLNSTKTKGELMIVSLWEKPVSYNPTVAVMQEKKISTSLGYRFIFPSVIELINNGMINEDIVITKKIHLDDITEEGFESILNDRTQCKILVTPKRSNL